MPRVFANFRRINLLLVLKILGIVCFFECVPVALALTVSAVYGGEDMWPFVFTLSVMLLVGFVFYSIGKDAQQEHADKRAGILIVSLTWILSSLIGMLPFIFGGYTKSLTDAFFESMSGFTTTGSSIFDTVEQLPHGILFWRSIMQWMGGIGIVVFTMALLPLVIGEGGAAMLYNAETTGITHERFLPRISEAAKRTSFVYFTITVILFVLLWAGPMEFFDAMCHALTCVSTGGYSTRNGSIADFNSPYLEYLLSIFMFIGSLSIGLLYFCFVGKPKKLFKDEEFRWFAILSSSFVLVAALWLMWRGEYATFEGNFRHALFEVYSLISSTGYQTANLVLWGPFFWCIMLFLMFVCGCSGSTSGGIKMSRLLVVVKNLHNEFVKRIHPSQVVSVRANGAVIPGKFVSQVLAFVSVYILLVFVGATLLTLDGEAFIDSLIAAVSSMGNVGPGLGSFASSAASASNFSKWVLSFLMLAGRLEIFTLLVIFHPAFWRR